MPRYRYAGPGPHDDGRGGVVRPGDEWDWPDEPAWGPWEPVTQSPQAAEVPPAAQQTPPATPAVAAPPDAATASKDGE